MRTLVASTIGTLMAWLGFVYTFAPDAPPIPQVALQNEIVAERLQLATSQSLLVLGSSMTARLPIADIAANAQAVGISGGTATAALALARASGIRPRVAVIELNRLAGEPDSAAMRALAVTAGPRIRWRALRAEFRPSTQAVSVIVRVSEWLRNTLMREDQRRASEERITRRLVPLERDSATSQRALDWARAALDEWRAAGTTVWLVELPAHANVAMSAAERRMIDRTLPDSLYARVTLGPGPWPTTDGRHLESRAARRAAAEILRATAGPPPANR